MKNEKILNILIGADLVPTVSNSDLFSSANINELLGKELVKILNKSDVRIFNLETPLIDKETPIKKCGPVLGINRSVISGIKSINPTFLTLANNHIMDHGLEGLNTTINTLKENDIDFGGVGCNLQEAKKILIKEIDGFKLGIYVCVEHEFSVATEFSAGANPFDPLESYDDIKSASKLCDYLIVLYHGGKEYYPYPSPILQKVCRKFVNCGANLVVCQHSHCIGTEETYKNKKIIYGQGNFLFDMINKIEHDNSLLISVNIDKSSKLEDIEYIVLSKKQNVIRLADSNISKKVLDEFKTRSKKIEDEKFIKENYSNFAYSNLYGTLHRFDLLSNVLVFKIINKLTKKRFEKFYFNKVYLKRRALALQNAIECEAWEEMILTALKLYNDKS